MLLTTEYVCLKLIGKISELWRYPVSSLGGWTAETVDIGENGIAGDRHFGLFDPLTGVVAAPEKDPRWRPALFLRSERADVDYARVIFPDGAAYHICDKALRVRLASHFGFDVAVGRYAHAPGDNNLPVISNRYQPSAIHVVTSASLKKLAEFVPSNDVDRRRLRPSIFLVTEALPEFLEDSWIGATLHFGVIEAKVTERTKRCGMTLVAQPGLDEEPEVLRSILRMNGRHLGVYCDILAPGTLSAGESVYLTP